MPDKVFKILFYIPYDVNKLSESDLNWIEQLSFMFLSSFNKILNRNVQIDNNIKTEGKINYSDYQIIIQLFIKENVEIDDCLQNIVNEKLNLVQIITNPKFSFDDTLNALDKTKSYELFYESNSTKDLFDFNNVKNETWFKLVDITYEINKSYLVKNNIDKKAIFIAETSADQKNMRDGLIREFKHLGFKVLPEDKLSDDLVKFSEQVHELMEQSILSIHVIGNNYAPLLKNIDVSKIEIQNDIFNEVVNNKENFKRYVWLPPNIKPKSEKQKKYIESFKRNIELLEKTEIIQTPIEILKNIVIKDIDDKTEQKRESKIEKENLAYIISDQNHEERVSELINVLKRKNIDSISLDKKSNTIELIKTHKKNLIKSDIVIIIYSSENEQWLNSKITDIIKAPGFGKKSKFNLKLLLMDAKKQSDTILKLKDLNVSIDSINNWNRNLSFIIV